MTAPQAPVIKFIDQSVPYADVLALQEAAVRDVIRGNGPETLFFVEHAPIYTLGSSAQEADVLNSNIPALKVGRGGQVTYHGPGQRVIYPILDLRQRGKDLRAHVNNLQYWVIAVLQELGIRAHLSDDVGVWVNTPSSETTCDENKIAAVGVRVRQWVTFHGLALNVHPDLSHYKGIVPCGIKDKGVTSLEALGIEADMAAVDDIFMRTFDKIFNSEVA